MDKKSLLAALKEKIAQAESKGDYNAYNQGRAVPKKGNLTELTLEELMRRQSLKEGDKSRIFAAGKYQVIPDTMKQAVAKLKLDKKMKFSPEMQEQLFDYLVKYKKPEINNFLEGRGDPKTALKAFSQEWASIGVPEDTIRKTKSGNIPLKRGESYYSGIGGNKAKIKPEEIEALLKQYKSMKSPVAPAAVEAPKVDLIKKEQDAAFERMIQQPQIPLIAESEQDFADGGIDDQGLSRDFPRDVKFNNDGSYLDKNGVLQTPNYKLRNRQLRNTIQQKGAGNVHGDAFFGKIELTSDERLLLQHALQKELKRKHEMNINSKISDTRTEGRLQGIEKEIIRNIESGKKYADGGYGKSSYDEMQKFLENQKIASGEQNSNSGLFPYRSFEDAQLAGKETDDLAEANSMAQAEIPEPVLDVPKVEQAPVVAPVKPIKTESEEPAISSAEAMLNKVMELRKKQKEELDKEYADKESSAKWKDVLGTAMGGLDKAFAHYGAANPNAILKPVHLEQEKQDRLEKVQVEKAGTLKDREKVIEDIMSQELKASSKSTLSNDPDSEASIRARAFASEMGIEIPENATELMINKVINTAIGRKTAQESSTGKANRFDRGLEFRKEMEERKKTEKNEGDAMNTLKMLKQSESWKSAEKTLAEVPTLKLLLNDARDQGGQSLAMLGPKIAKSIAGEVGVLTEADVTRYVKDPALARSLMDFYTKLSQGKLTDTSYENLMRLVDLSEMAAKDKINKVVDDGAELYSRRSGLSKEEARYLLDNEYKKPVAPKVKIKQKASGRVKAFPPEEAQRLLMEKPDEYEEVK